MTTRHTAPVVLLGATGLFLSLGLRATAADAPDTISTGAKVPEVSTVGTETYAGPNAAELAKLALVEASPQTPPTQAKVAEASTVGPAVVQIPTPEALAKLAEYLATPVTLPLPEMSKLDAMKVITEGTPELSPAELEKRAHELAALRTNTSAPSEEGAR